MRSGPIPRTRSSDLMCFVSVRNFNVWPTSLKKKAGLSRLVTIITEIFFLFTSSFYLSVYLFRHCIYSFIFYLVVAIEANEHVGSGGDSNLHHILPCALSCGFRLLTQLAIKIHTNSNFLKTILTLGFPCNHHAISPVDG